MAKIFVTGPNGQVGSEFRKLEQAHSEHTFLFDDIDITDREQLFERAAIFVPEVVINCAAYTAVDKAEDEEIRAMTVNSKGVENLVALCQNHQALLIHYSTDYVFDGANHRPYTETDVVNPIGVYGKSKLAGEQIVLNSDISAVVMRTSWVYSAFGNNFVKTMIRLGRERGSLNVVFDQVGTPTNAHDLAQATMQIVAQRDKLMDQREVFHYSNEGVTTWYDFAHAIFELAQISCHVSPILSSQYPTRTQRPHYSVLDKTKVKGAFGLGIPHWRESLAQVLHTMVKTYAQA